MNISSRDIITSVIAIGLCLLGFSSCKRILSNPPRTIYGPPSDFEWKEVPVEQDTIPANTTTTQTKE